LEIGVLISEAVFVAQVEAAATDVELEDADTTVVVRAGVSAT
jgi:hypothetical protein